MTATSTSRDRTSRYRQALRRKGLRPVQIWLPDTRAPDFAAEVLAQCQRINVADRAEDLMQWVEQVSVFDDDEAR
jgi:Uma2 family endonuclease